MHLPTLLKICFPWCALRCKLVKEFWWLPTVKHQAAICSKVGTWLYQGMPLLKPCALCQARGNTSTMGLLADSCTNTTIRNLTIYHAGSFALFQTNGSNNTFMCGTPPPAHASIEEALGFCPCMGSMCMLRRTVKCCAHAALLHGQTLTGDAFQRTTRPYRNHCMP